jgi:sialidase-1
MNRSPAVIFIRLWRLVVPAVLAGLASQATAVEKTNLFQAGEGGYAMYRIPALVVTPQQTLLAACEARKLGRGDWDHVDLLLRRSTDGGRTWEAARELVGQRDLPLNMARNPAAIAAGLGRDGVFTINNPTWIADASTGETHLLYCVEYGRAFIITSRDGGATFSRPREITQAFETFRSRDGYAWRVIAIGPGHGVRLSTGRLLAAVWLSTGEGGHAHRPSVCATIYSDNQGATWLAGEIVARDPHPLANPSECAVVETTPGRVMLNIRCESPRNRRAIAWSADGATNWSRPEFDDALIEPVCMAGLTRMETVTAGAPHNLLFSNPDSIERRPDAPTTSTSRVRQNLTLRASRDGGKTWPVSRVLEPDHSAYSDLAAGADGTIYCFYERGDMGPYEKLTFACITPALLLKGSP